MDSIGLNTGHVLVQYLFLLLVLTWTALSLGAIFSLRSKQLDGQTQVLWVLAIPLVPILGALAFWIINLGQQS